uniref:RNA helicase n=1 Tax=Kalanchoe fedtschenkoi TaxID=63787 RepID=A0A7N0UF15_KALFE
MENDSSFLFIGTKFDRKKFSKDFDRFKEKKKDADSVVENVVTEDEKENGGPEKEIVPVPVSVSVSVSVSSRKRKRKGMVMESVDGFRVFKPSKKVGSEFEQEEEAVDIVAQRKKELNRQMECDALLRKKYNIHTSGNNVPSPLSDFKELMTSYQCEPYILRNLAKLGFKEPTPIQRQAIPVLLSGRECFACAPTGSGKTLAFICPMLIKLKCSSADGIRAVILCPTRELAAQTTRECKKLAKGKKFYVRLMTSELKTADFSKLRCDILISTPRRLQFSIRRKRLDLSRVEYLVLDESDKLFELSLMKQIDSVVKACSNPSIIRSLFSATLPDRVEELARTIMHDAVRVIIGRKNSASETIKQTLLFAGSEEGKLLGLRQSFAEVFLQDDLISRLLCYAAAASIEKRVLLSQPGRRKLGARISYIQEIITFVKSYYGSSRSRTAAGDGNSG